MSMVKNQKQNEINATSSIKTKFIFILKITFIICAFYYLFKNIQINKIERYVKDIDYVFFVFAEEMFQKIIF